MLGTFTTDTNKGEYNMITGQQFVNVSELDRVVIIKQILMGMTPTESIIISIGSYKTMMRTLEGWEKDLNQAIHLEGVGP